MRTNVWSLAKWATNGATNTPAFRHTQAVLENFICPASDLPNTEAFILVWSTSVDLERLQVKCEICFLLEAVATAKPYDTTDPLKLLNTIVDRAQILGRLKARAAHEDFVAKALIGGAGVAHKLAKIDSALPPLQLVFKDTVDGKTVFVNEPREVATRHSQPWEATWDARNPLFNIGIVK